MKNSDKKSRLGAPNHPSKSDAKSDARSDANTDVAPDRTNPQSTETVIVNTFAQEVYAIKNGVLQSLAKRREWAWQDSNLRPHPYQRDKWCHDMPLRYR